MKLALFDLYTSRLISILKKSIAGKLMSVQTVNAKCRLNYFDKSYKYSKQYPNSSVLKYSIKRIVNLNVKPKNWPLYESFLLKSAILESNVLPNIIDILAKHSLKKKYLLDYEKISDTLSDIIIYHSELKHSFEVSWALWLSKILGGDRLSG